MDLLGKIRLFFDKYKTPRYRDRRAFYASELMKDARDIYWSATGEPVTNPTDYLGNVRMSVGKWVEQGFLQDVVSNLHLFGLHRLNSGSEQIITGISLPVNVDGKLDDLLVERVGDKFGKKYVLEIKTINGYGADKLLSSLDPSEKVAYLAQMGFYLHDLHNKGVTDEGVLLFFPLSDKNLGNILVTWCRYEPGTQEVVAYRVDTLFGATQEIDVRLAMKPLFDRLEKLQGHIERREVPPAEHFYKYPLTREFLDKVEDRDLQRAIKGEKILGDWEIRYSAYFDKHLAMEGSPREYTPEELAILEAEYRARHPRSKVGGGRR